MLFLPLILSLTIFTFANAAQGKSLNERDLSNVFSICYDEYGCFTKLAPFSGSWYRPVALLPESPQTIGTRFFLYTRENRAGVPIGRGKTGLGMGSWNPKRMTRFVIHGLIENYKDNWYSQMRQAFFDYEDSNIIFVDWSRGNRFPYNQATANTQVVGAEVALLIQELISKWNANRMLIHIIGHSLGAHTAGYAGSRIKPLIGRITGLDPAGPLFEFTDPIVRLDSSDGQFVDIIHTDGQANIKLGLGLSQPLGHVDFYPNGGLEQPSCAKMTGKIFDSVVNALNGYDGFGEVALCSHLFSVYLFTDSMKSKDCSYLSYSCSSMDQMKINDQCFRNARNEMGIKASSVYPGVFYLRTKSAKQCPFCQNLYSITLTLENDNVKIVGQIEMIFANQSIVFDQEKNVPVPSGLHITRIVPIGQSLNNVTSIQLKLKYQPSQSSQPITQISMTNMETGKSLKFCPTANRLLYFHLC